MTSVVRSNTIKERFYSAKKLLGASVYREEKLDKHYKHCVTFGSIYVNTATSGRSKTSKGNESFLALLRILGNQCSVMTISTFQQAMLMPKFGLDFFLNF
eukprot:GFUD01070197.1.p1 GENE.GFUD01070197.1~~GFUD01070197.1.p1  ORF type:complete len:100 (+),score=9.15 GFUD01070197.1:27-326(+)